MSNENTYRLINPYIEGDVETVAKSRNSTRAAKKIYDNISQHFQNRVDNFFMTTQNLQTKDLSHFLVRETKNKEGEIKYGVKSLSGNFDTDIEKNLLKNINNLEKQSGGKHKNKRKRHRLDDDDDTDSDTDSSSDSFDDDFKFPSQPVSRFTYFYLPYFKINTIGLSPIDANRIFLPIFNLPVNPSLEIRFDIFKYP